MVQFSSLIGLNIEYLPISHLWSYLVWDCPSKTFGLFVPRSEACV